MTPSPAEISPLSLHDALPISALELALDRDGQAAAATHAAETDEPDALTEAADATTTATLEQRKADALVALARTYLDTEPSDRAGEDRHLVIVELNADTLTAHPLTPARAARAPEIGRASCRDRAWVPGGAGWAIRNPYRTS